MMEDIKGYLDSLVEKNNTKAFIKDDPVQFPHRYSDVQDIEIVSFLVATIAWGNRKMILNNSNKMLGMMGKSPYDYVMSDGWKNLEPDKCVHRTFFNRDLIYYCNGLKAIYQKHSTLEDIFAVSHDTWRGIQNFRDLIGAANGETNNHISNPCCDEPKKGSACKRLHMALRWLVRDDGIVDLGIWKRLSPKDLMIPLDVHVARVSRDLGLIDRKNNDRQTVELLTAKLRDFDANDPVKYDFALFGAELM
ncbi:MAG: TIGR02757 family protein [Bacteroidales bacterium]|nr:TIGR02757 family protein [Bacteroidales bacterium]